MTKEQVFDRILDRKIIAIIRGQQADIIRGLAQALYQGGVDLIEVTFSQSKPETWTDTLQGIHEISQMHGDRLLAGAGTVTSVDMVRQAHEAGAKYIISPNVDPAVIAETRALGMVSLPGAMTPTEVQLAYSLGADAVKLFPAGALGPDYIRALRAPLSQIPLMAVGGVSEENAAAWLQAGCVGIGVGGHLANAALAKAGRFAEITALAERYRKAIDEA